MTKRSGTPTTANAQRGRPMVTITLSPAGLAELDFRREGSSRGEYIELLLKVAALVPTKTQERLRAEIRGAGGVK